MKTLLNDTKLIEGYITNTLKVDERLVFEARLILEPWLRYNIMIQKKLHHLVKHYGRRKLKNQLESIHHRLFNDPSRIEFQKRIFKMF